MCYKLGITVDAQQKLREVIAADGNSVYTYIYKFVQQNDIGGNLHHHIQLE